MGKWLGLPHEEMPRCGAKTRSGGIVWALLNEEWSLSVSRRQVYWRKEAV